MQVMIFIIYFSYLNVPILKASIESDLVLDETIVNIKLNVFFFFKHILLHAKIPF